MIAQYFEGFRRHLLVVLGLAVATADAYLDDLVEFDEWIQGNDYSGHITTLQREDLEEYMNWCFRKGNSNSTRRAKLVAIRRLWSYLIYARIVEHNITVDLPLPKKGRKRPRIYQREEILRLFTGIPLFNAEGQIREKCLRDIVILVLLAFGGLRVDEICSLRIEDVVENDRGLQLHIVGKGDKFRVVRTIFRTAARFVLDYILVRIAQGATPKDPLLVSYRKGDRAKGGRLTEGAIDDLVKDLAARARLRKARNHAHMFRATNATHLMQVEGWDLHVVREHLGHASITTTEENYIADFEPRRKKYPSYAAMFRDFGLKLWANRGDTDANTHGEGGRGGTIAGQAE
ncbi:MAG: tyrosine-type recombinase/integrase [Nitrospirales bacterium]|nr:tyrosine-type recombinase/integrase [Nitrospirales bacterium]